LQISRHESARASCEKSIATSIALGAGLLDQAVKHVARDLLEELTEEAADSYYGLPFRFCLGRHGSGYPESNEGAYRNLFSCQRYWKVIDERSPLFRFWTSVLVGIVRSFAKQRQDQRCQGSGQELAVEVHAFADQSNIPPEAEQAEAARRAGGPICS
jgi:hypothetical protein